MTDHNGVVILTSRPQWRFRATRPLTAEERQAIIAIQPYPTRDPQPHDEPVSVRWLNPIGLPTFDKPSPPRLR